jgi:aminomethyltransferase
MEQLKKTRLHPFHLNNGAQMARFGHYEMPLWYKAGVKAEHLSVIRGAGIFDTSHMAALLVQGTDSRSLLQRCLSKDLEHAFGRGRPLVDNRCVYSIILAENGTAIDDTICYQLRSDGYLLVVNSGMGDPVADHLRTERGAMAATITNLAGTYGKMDIQGPASLKVLNKLVRNPAEIFSVMPYFSFAGGGDLFGMGGVVKLNDGTPVLISRTGYTGEFGFELYCSDDKLASLWDQVRSAGEEFALLPCGLAARDSLRAGAGLPLSHQDIGPWPFLNNPWQFALPWQADLKSFSKSFIGDQALLRSAGARHTLPFAGYDPRKIAAVGEDSVVDAMGKPLGRVLTCTTDMAIDRQGGEIISIAENNELDARGLCCGFVLVPTKIGPGERVFLTDGKRKIPVEIRDNIRPGRTAHRPLADMR